MGVNKTSIDSYEKLKKEGVIGIRQYQVLMALDKLQLASNREIAEHLGWQINRVTGRITELRKAGLVIYAGTKKDLQTNRTVNVWKPVSRRSIK